MKRWDNLLPPTTHREVHKFLSHRIANHYEKTARAYLSMPVNTA
jgi:hypothetical protein